MLYSDKDNMSGEDPSTVPPEWHGAPLHLKSLSYQSRSLSRVHDGIPRMM